MRILQSGLGEGPTLKEASGGHGSGQKPTSTTNVSDVPESSPAGSDPASKESSASLRSWKSAWPALVAVAGVSTYAVAAPLFSLVGSEATFFVAHNSGSLDVVLFAFVVMLAPVLLVAVLVAIGSTISEPLGRLVLALGVGSLGAVALLQALPSTWYQRGLVHVGIGVVLTVVFAFLFSQAAFFRQFVQVLGYTAPLILGMFLFASGASEIVFTGEERQVGAGAQKDIDVVLLVFDELSLAGLLDNDLNIDSVKYPAFAELAATSTWYDQATTVSPRTQWAVPSILTGRKPMREEIPTASVHPQNLFTTLAPSHQIDGSEIVTRLCPDSICEAEAAIRTEPSLYSDAQIVYLHTALPRSLADRWLPPISDRWAGFGDSTGPQEGELLSADAQSEQTSPEAFDWLNSDLAGDHLQRWERSLEQLGSRSTPTVSYHHALVPHAPYTFLNDGSLYNGETLDGLDTRRDAWESDQAVVDTAIRRYVQQIQLVDGWVGDAVSKLKKEGRFDNSIIVVTADHGTALTAGLSRRSPTATTAADVAYVPLFVKYPGQTEGERDHRQAQTIDVFPTIADIVELPLSDPVDGRSLVEDWTEAERSIFDLPAELDFESVLDLASAVDRITTVVPSGATGSSIYSTINGIDYSGRDISSFEMAVGVDATALPARADLLSDVSLANGFVPARFTARTVGLPLGQEVLIALNGKVAGVAAVGEWKGDSVIAALLDPSTMVEGQNRIEIFVVAQNTIRSVNVEDASPHNVEVGEDGRVVSVHLGDEVWDSVRPGFVGYADTESDAGLLQGWVADIDAKELPHTILLLDGGEVLSAGFRRIPRSDVSELYGSEIEESGIQLALSPELSARIQELTVLALFADGGFLEFP